MKRKVIALALVLAFVGTTFLTGCGGGGSTVDSSKVAFAARYELPVSTWDPAVCSDTSNQVLLNIYETLLRYEPDTNTFKKVLATDYTSNADGTVWTFNLREGVKFHDGTDFNAEAVKYSIERTIAGEMGTSYIWAPLKEVNVVDTYTVEFVLNQPIAFDYIVSCANAAYIYSPTAVKAAGATFEDQTNWFSEGNECGTGPYVLDSQTPGDQVVVAKYDGYWGGWEGNHLDKVIFKLVSEDASRRQMLESGEADLVTSLMVEDIDALKDNPDVQVVVSEGISSMIAYLNTEKPPLDNILVRQALAFAFPYDAVAEQVKKGYASVGTGVIPKNMWGSLESPTYGTNLDKAKELLTEAGFPDGGFTLTYTYGAGREDRKKTAELFKAELAKLGIVLEIQAMPWDSQWAMAHNTDPNQRQDIFSTKYWSDIISPYDQFYSLVRSEETINWNLSYYKNSEVDNLIDKAGKQAATDRDAAISTFETIGELVNDDCVIINEGDQRSIMIMSKSFQGYVPNSAYIDTVFFYDCYKE